MRIDSVYYPRAPLRMTVRNQKRKHCAGVENGLKQTWRLSVQVCMLLPPWFAVLLHQKTNYSTSWLWRTRWRGRRGSDRRCWVSVIAIVLYTTKDKIKGGFWYTKRFLEPLISVCVPYFFEPSLVTGKPSTWSISSGFLGRNKKSRKKKNF